MQDFFALRRYVRHKLTICRVRQAAAHFKGRFEIFDCL